MAEENENQRKIRFWKRQRGRESNAADGRAVQRGVLCGPGECAIRLGNGMSRSQTYKPGWVRVAVKREFYKREKICEVQTGRLKVVEPGERPAKSL